MALESIAGGVLVVLVFGWLAFGESVVRRLSSLDTAPELLGLEDIE